MTRARHPFRWLRGSARRFFRLSGADRRLLLYAVCGLAAVKVALRCLPLQVTQRALAHVGRLRERPVSPKPREHVQALERSVWAVSTASGLVPGGGNCLVRALTLQTLLARYGVVTEVQFGFARAKSGTVEGHAWLTHRGRVLIGDLTDLERFESTPARATKVGR